MKLYPITLFLIWFHLLIEFLVISLAFYGLKPNTVLTFPVFSRSRKICNMLVWMIYGSIFHSLLRTYDSYFQGGNHFVFRHGSFSLTPHVHFTFFITLLLLLNFTNFFFQLVQSLFIFSYSFVVLFLNFYYLITFYF